MSDHGLSATQDAIAAGWINADPPSSTWETRGGRRIQFVVELSLLKGRL